MDWIFEGIGTLIIGLILGAAGGGAAGWRVGRASYIKQVQRAGDHANQTQVGGNQVKKRKK